MNIVIATLKSWNVELAEQLKEELKPLHQVTVLTKKEELTIEALEKIQPSYVFFPHWSYIIKKEIYEKFNCVVFHMTDLPFGRGGSPLQNLIANGYKETKISAIKVIEKVDAGPIYMKEPLTLEGSAEEIFRRAANIIFRKMIPDFLKENPVAVPQTGEPLTFRRRKPEESELVGDMSLDKIYDYIRMLDAEGYPNAFLSFGKYRLLFQKARKDGKTVIAEVRFTETENES